MNDLRGTSVLVLGLGDSGLAMARWCAPLCAQVRVWDSRWDSPPGPPQAAALAEFVPAALRIEGPLTGQALLGIHRILKSPGLAPNDARIAPLLKQAREAGIAVQGELDVFIQALRDLQVEYDYTPRIVAVTGTNGKTTTTAMAAQLIARTGKRVATAGNIGPTLLQTLADLLAPQAGAASRAAELSASLPEVWVLELSSFQLDGVTGFEPDAAALLNITEDHLDWHGGMAQYTAAKARIFGPRTVRVLNRDDEGIARLAREPMPPAAQRRGTGKVRASLGGPRVVWFGLDAPRRPGDFGLLAEDGMAWLVRAQVDEDMPRRGAVAPAEELHVQRLMPADGLRVRGRHNAANALAALALATAIGCPLAPMLHGLREYRGEPHRVEHLGSAAGVDFFDDSKGTNVGATVAALNGLGADRLPAKLVVILGGDGKGQDFAPLRDPVQRLVRAVATIGKDAPGIEAALDGLGLKLARHATLEAATQWCFEQAHSGDAVLLSPACASLDMFRNYGHRAEVFAQAYRSIASERGELN
ncbi:MAG: UDP-N-acetylmuramoyl-L-alanine--D-glutamate ligase [Burkholderiaceae bacterium]